VYYQRKGQYDARTGWFTQMDPIGLAGGLNLYGFAGGDPINFSDPFGLFPCGLYELPGCKGPSLFSTSRQVANALGAFARNYRDMRQANTIDSDLYFHCMANCEAANEGQLPAG
jgi:uncharacterized protein RhaS with RHS repeats